MPRIKSAKKQLRQSEQRHNRNQAIKSRVKTVVRAARTAIAAATDPQQAETAVRMASRIVDKAVTKGVVHPKAAARRKSRLARQAAKATS